MNKKKINNLRNRGFVKLSIPVVLIITAAALIIAGCSGSDENKPAPVSDNVSEVQKNISDNSMTFSGKITEATCLECHPSIKDGGFNIDFDRVRKEKMLVGKGMELKKAQSDSDVK